MKTIRNILKATTCTLLILTVNSVLSLRAQDHYITFTGSGKSTMVDSVIVENLSQGTKLTLKGTDTLHLVAGTTGIEPISGNIAGKIKFYPNPAIDQSRMQFDLPEPCETMISMFDIAGREISGTRDILPQGRHTYLIQSGSEGLYIVRIISGRNSYSGKLLFSGSQNRNAEILFETSGNTEAMVKSHEKQTGSKGSPGRKDMPYNPGERLQYKTFGGGSSTVSTDVPSITGNDYTINSVFVDCSDADNNHYSAVLIGNQIWMGENLKTTRLTNGMPILNISDNTEWGNTSVPAYCWYNNDPENKNIYGAIYNWYTAASNTVCPVGWHVPTDDDWSILNGYLGWFHVGGKLKQTGTTYWRSPNTGATNETGFTGLPGGYRTVPDYSFSGLHEKGYFWNSTPLYLNDSRIVKLYYEYDYMYSDDWHYPTNGGGSIRCIRDAGFMKDNDGNLYTTIKIGGQQWMGENLKTTRFRDGTAIPLVTNNTAWKDLNAPGYCWYENEDVINKNNYGALYNWYTINTGNLCPTGWHVPTDDDWTILITYYGGESLAGGALKETGTIFWSSPNNATNESGFTGRPGGLRDLDGEFYSAGYFGQWWSATEVLESNAYLRIIGFSNLNVTRTWNNKGTGMSVRCLKDNVPEYIRDRDGNNYLTVTIGTQTWMAENLRADFLNDGGYIPEVTDRNDWINLTSPGYCWYNNDQANGATYGALYNWYAINTGKLCPTGWHMPTNEDWTTLTDWLGDQAIAGGKLKEAGTAHWFGPNTGATNFSGFTGLPGGSRINNFANLGYTANWWSADDINTYYGLNYTLEYNKTDFSGSEQHKYSGISVRCLKDQAAIVKDKDGNVYPVSKIGEQSWMGENLKTTHLNDGTEIPLVTNATQWGNLLTPGYCWYDNDEAFNKDTYGALYNWPSVSSGKLCPAGWHVPSEADWTVLTYHLGGISFAGGKLKEAGTTHWLTPNLAAINETGFTALPGGYRSDIAFLKIGEYGSWWSSTEMKSMPLYAYHRLMKYNSSNLSQEYYPKVGGMSVRCLKDGLKDFDGNNYATIQVGNQEWMAENLKTTHYNDGTEIPLVTDPTAWSNLDTQGYCWYNNDEYSNKDRYGALYNFYTLLQPSEEVCPAGWHVPLRYEWEELIEYLGGENVAGGKLKEAGFTHWSEPNTGSTNETGFTALPGGFRSDIPGMVGFMGMNVIGYWWTTQGEGSGPEVYASYLKNDNSKIGFELKNWGWGLSLRCMRYK